MSRRLDAPMPSASCLLDSSPRLAPDARARLKRDPAVRAIVRAWRSLTGNPKGGAPTVVACSAGADSSALLLALATATDRLVVAHIVHDLRPPAQALADRDAAQRLAARLGLEIAEASVTIHTPGSKGNAEARARSLRYQALAHIAAARDIRFIAAAHHAGDQLESILMALIRGAGPRGLSGIAPTRRLADSAPTIRLIRPMLAAATGREDSERICRAAGWTWQEDHTNRDTTRLRAHVRHNVIPVLGTPSLREGSAIERRAARAASLLRDAAHLIDDRASEIWPQATIEPVGDRIAWDRVLLRAQRPIVLGSLLRRAFVHLRARRALDRLGGKQIDPVVRSIRSRTTDPRSFAWPGITIRITARRVEVLRSEP